MRGQCDLWTGRRLLVGNCATLAAHQLLSASWCAVVSTGPVGALMRGLASERLRACRAATSDPRWLQIGQRGQARKFVSIFDQVGFRCHQGLTLNPLAKNQ